MYSRKFYVVKLLEIPSPNVPEYVCVPCSWIKIRTGRRVKVAYPTEDAETTKKRVQNEELASRKWKTYMATEEFRTDQYDDADIHIDVLDAINIDKNASLISDGRPSDESEEIDSKTKNDLEIRNDLEYMLLHNMEGDQSSSSTRKETQSSVTNLSNTNRNKPETKPNKNNQENRGKSSFRPNKGKLNIISNRSSKSKESLIDSSTTPKKFVKKSAGTICEAGDLSRKEREDLVKPCVNKITNINHRHHNKTKLSKKLKATPKMHTNNNISTASIINKMNAKRCYVLLESLSGSRQLQTMDNSSTASLPKTTHPKTKNNPSLPSRENKKTDLASLPPRLLKRERPPGISLETQTKNKMSLPSLENNIKEETSTISVQHQIDDKAPIPLLAIDFNDEASILSPERLKKDNSPAASLETKDNPSMPSFNDLLANTVTLEQQILDDASIAPLENKIKTEVFTSTLKNKKPQNISPETHCEVKNLTGMSHQLTEMSTTSLKDQTCKGSYESQTNNKVNLPPVTNQSKEEASTQSLEHQIRDNVDALSPIGTQMKELTEPDKNSNPQHTPIERIHEENKLASCKNAPNEMSPIISVASNEFLFGTKIEISKLERRINIEFLNEDQLQSMQKMKVNHRQDGEVKITQLINEENLQPQNEPDVAYHCVASQSQHHRITPPDVNGAINDKTRHKSQDRSDHAMTKDIEFPHQLLQQQLSDANRHNGLSLIGITTQESMNTRQTSIQNIADAANNSFPALMLKHHDEIRPTDEIVNMQSSGQTISRVAKLSPQLQEGVSCSPGKNITVEYRPLNQVTPSTPLKISPRQITLTNGVHSGGKLMVNKRNCINAKIPAKSVTSQLCQDPNCIHNRKSHLIARNHTPPDPRTESIVRTTTNSLTTQLMMPNQNEHHSTAKQYNHQNRYVVNAGNYQNDIQSRPNKITKASKKQPSRSNEKRLAPTQGNWYYWMQNQKNLAAQRSINQNATPNIHYAYAQQNTRCIQPNTTYINQSGQFVGYPHTRQSWPNYEYSVQDAMKQSAHPPNPHRTPPNAQYNSQVNQSYNYYTNARPRNPVYYYPQTQQRQPVKPTKTLDPTQSTLAVLDPDDVAKQLELYNQNIVSNSGPTTDIVTQYSQNIGKNPIPIETPVHITSKTPSATQKHLQNQAKPFPEDGRAELVDLANNLWRTHDINVNHNIDECAVSSESNTEESSAQNSSNITEFSPALETPIHIDSSDDKKESPPAVKTDINIKHNNGNKNIATLFENALNLYREQKENLENLLAYLSRNMHIMDRNVSNTRELVASISAEHSMKKLAEEQAHIAHVSKYLSGTKRKYVTQVEGNDKSDGNHGNGNHDNADYKVPSKTLRVWKPYQ